MTEAADLVLPDSLDQKIPTDGSEKATVSATPTIVNKIQSNYQPSRMV